MPERALRVLQAAIADAGGEPGVHVSRARVMQQADVSELEEFSQIADYLAGQGFHSRRAKQLRSLRRNAQRHRGKHQIVSPVSEKISLSGIWVNKDKKKSLSPDKEPILVGEVRQHPRATSVQRTVPEYRAGRLRLSQESRQAPVALPDLPSGQERHCHRNGISVYAPLATKHGAKG